MGVRKIVRVLWLLIWIAAGAGTLHAADIKAPHTTLKDVTNALSSESVEAIVETMNDIKREGSSELVGLALDLWNNKETKYPALSWSIIRSPRVRIELADILIQADRNGIVKINKDEMRLFARQVLKGPDEEAKRTPVLALGLLNNKNDVELLRDVAALENPVTFRAAIIALAKICDPSAQDAIKALRGRVRSSENRNFLETPASTLAPFRRCEK